MGKLQERWIPSISDVASAKKIASQGVWVSLIIAGLTSALAIFKVFGYNYWALGDAFLFTVIAFGIDKMWRSAAVAGLTLYIIEMIFKFIDIYRSGQPTNPGLGYMSIVIIFAYVNSIRGTFAYQKFKAPSEGTGEPLR